MATKMDEHQSRLVCTMDAVENDEYSKIRDAYYKAVEGLQCLANVLELADARQARPAGALLDEHFIAVKAFEVMQGSSLGKIV